MAERVVERGRHLEDFEVGAVYKHHWGRTLTEAEAVTFAADTMNFNPIYFNREHAKSLGHPDVVVCPWYVLMLVLGLSVEDVSERSTGLLGYGNAKFLRPVYPGDTILAESEVVEIRESKSKPDQGIVKTRLRGTNQKGELVLTFERTNLIKRRPR
jgi:acyl dehydratase